MEKLYKKLLIVILIFTAFIVRLWRMEYIPFPNDADELAYVFAGESLIEKGSPVSWTIFSESYPSSNYEDFEGYSFVEPWLDHPFLLPLIEGGVAKLFGYSFPSIPPTLIIRLPMIILSAVTLLLIFLITHFFFGYYPALFSLILIGFSPSIIIIQRMVVGENVYIPLLLSSFYLLIKERNLVAVIVVSALAGLAKVPGAITIPLLTMWLILNKQYKKAAVYTFGATALFMLAYFLYGYFTDWQQFMTILNTQSHRFIGWSNPAFILSKPGFHIQEMLDASYYLIFALGMYTVIRPQTSSKPDRMLLLATIASFFLVWVSSGEFEPLGWYKLPLFIWLTIAAAAAVSRSNFSPAVPILVGVSALSNLGLIRTPEQARPDPVLLRSLVVTTGFSLFLYFLLSKKVARQYKYLLTVSAIALYMAVGVYVTGNYYTSLCRNAVCPIPQLTLGQVFKQVLQKPSN